MTKPDAKYIRIKEHLLRGIATRRFESMLPSENELARTFSVSRMTARKALGELVWEGYAQRVPGKGTFVTPQRFAQGFFRVQPFHRYAEAQNAAVRIRVLEATLVEAPADIARRLRHPQAVRVRRIQFFDDVPVRYELRYLRADMCKGLIGENLQQESIHEILVHKLNLPLTRVWQHLEVTALSAEIAQLFGEPSGSPAFLMKRLTYTFEEPVTHVEYFMRQGYFAFEDTFWPNQEEAALG
jgi:GntR family transcriptional regulator